MKFKGAKIMGFLQFSFAGGKCSVSLRPEAAASKPEPAEPTASRRRAIEHLPPANERKGTRQRQMFHRRAARGGVKGGFSMAASHQQTADAHFAAWSLLENSDIRLPPDGFTCI
jgi:hypothetical protein